MSDTPNHDQIEAKAVQKIAALVDQALAAGQAAQALQVISAMNDQWGHRLDFQLCAMKAAMTAGEKLRALEISDKILGIVPDHEIGLIQRAVLSVQLGKFDAGIMHLPDLIKRFPEKQILWKWLGHAYHETGRLEEAANAYEQLRNDNLRWADIRQPLAFVYRNLGDVEKSNSLFEAALDDENCVEDQRLITQFALAQNYLSQGRLEEGFKLYESRWARKQADQEAYPAPFWKQGDDLTGKTVLVIDEQGFGDCIQFSRFVSALQEVAGQVIVRMRPKLHRLLADPLKGFQVVDDLSKADLVPIDYVLPMMSLPLVLGLSKDDIDAKFSSSYINASTDLKATWRIKLKELSANGSVSKKKIGLVWQGDLTSAAEQGRSLSFADIYPIFQNNDCHFYILQMDDGRDRFDGLSLPDNVTDLGAILDKDGDAFVDTAAVMAHMDLVISSDTATAHLAGALQVRSCVLLKYVPEWRWGLGGDKSYWYRDMQLIRQVKRGDWSSVISSLQEKIGKLT